MTDIKCRKAQLRSDLRQRRNALTLDQQNIAALAVIDSVVSLPDWKNAQKIAMYLAIDGEINTSALKHLARGLRKEIFLPLITANDLGFAQWHENGLLSPNRYNIPQPLESSVQCPASELDIIFLPMVGWDRHGGRLGMGGGFYDRALSNISDPVLVGLAHESQRVNEIPSERWDITLDYVATDAGLYHCRKQSKF